MKIKFLTIFFISFIVAICNTTDPGNVKKSDTQKITSIEYGYILSSTPIKVKGEGSAIGATAGGLIGGLLGTQVCGEKEVIGTKCQDIAVIFGAIGGAAAGTVIQATLGDHNGFQYIVNIDSCGESSLTCENNKDKAFVQGDKDPIPNGQRVVIIYGKDTRIMPYEE